MGRSDLWIPIATGEGFDWDSWEYDDGNMQDERLALWLGGNSPSPHSQLNMTGGLVVEEVEADAYGGAALTLSGGYRLVIFPAGADGEDWRLLQCHRKGSHFVVEGGKVQG